MSPWERLPNKEFSFAEQGLTHGGGIHCRTQELNEQSKGFKFTIEEQPKANKIQKGGYVGDTLPEFYLEMLEFLRIS